MSLIPKGIFSSAGDGFANAGYAGGFVEVTTTNTTPPHVSQGVMAAQTQAPSSRWSEANLLSMLYSRFGWNVDVRCPFKRALPVRVTDEVVAVFLVMKGAATIVEDDAYLYPSDALVTQMRLLAETQC